VGHLVLERFAVVLDLGGADMAAGRENVSMLADVLQRGRFAEPGNFVALESLSPRQAW
jgi:hypothetical protein